ncbi:ribonuclease H-like domain-containing protein [Candidatus Bipolaricaulota bacterium]|nr:ribonuclease H-like domain-containing protein [Candidatus Bipolaricaulota bacterium]
MARDTLDEIARRLREEVEHRYERELIEGPRGGDAGVSGLLPFAPLEPEAYRRAKILERLLLEEFSGASLEELYETERRETDYGPAFSVVDRRPLPRLSVEPERCRDWLCGALRLLWGIGPATEQRLKVQGYRSLFELVRHPRWAREADGVLKAIEARDLRRLSLQVGRWYAVSHPLALSLIGLAKLERIVFLDIETLGTMTEPVILVGLAWPEGGELFIRQLVVRAIPEELPVLIETAQALERAEALVSFNGRAFDVNFLQGRFDYYGLPARLEQPNFDLLYFARRRWREELPNCRLETLERHVLGIERPLDVPSALVPEFYVSYLRERNVGPLVAVIEHNRQDLLSMVHLLSRLWEEWLR